MSLILIFTAVLIGPALYLAITLTGKDQRITPITTMVAGRFSYTNSLTQR